VDEREAGRVKGRKTRLLWMRGKLAGCEERWLWNLSALNTNGPAVAVKQ